MSAIGNGHAQIFREARVVLDEEMLIKNVEGIGHLDLTDILYERQSVVRRINR